MGDSVPNAIEKLRVDGPQPLKEVWPRSIPDYLRDRGFRTFQPGQILHEAAVAYLADEHEPRAIVAAWLEANDVPKQDGPTPWKLYNVICDYDDRFREASQDLLGPFERHDMQEKTDLDPSGECPLCGEDFDGYLPQHLPCDS